MSNSQQPQEPEKKVYQRDKTAKDPVISNVESEAKSKPKPRPRKAFVPKKLTKKSSKPQEYRVRHIRLSTLEPANLFHKALLDFQNELDAEVVEGPDKPFHDRKKVENYFIRIAKKYSICSTKSLGGDLDWIYKGMNVQKEIMTLELINKIIETEKYVIPEPIQTKLGYHIILVCENRDREEKVKLKAPPKPKSAPTGTNIPT